jgi:hypothetical protein
MCIGDEIAELLLIPAEPDATLAVQAATVKGLQPSTTYTVAYAGFNSLGYGPYRYGTLLVHSL